MNTEQTSKNIFTYIKQGSEYSSGFNTHKWSQYRILLLALCIFVFRHYTWVIFCRHFCKIFHYFIWEFVMLLREAPAAEFIFGKMQPVSLTELLGMVYTTKVFWVLRRPFLYTVYNSETSSNFLVWKFWGKAQFP